MIISAIGEKTISSEQIEYQTALKSLMERPDFIIEHKEKTKTVSLSETGKNIDLEKLDSNAIDVEADVPHVHAARIHPLKDTINEIRDTFVHLGFTEINGNLSQSSFWNFDAHYLLHKITQLENYKTHFILKVLMQNNLQHQLKLRMYQMHTKKVGDIIGIYRKQKKWFCEHILLVSP